MTLFTILLVLIFERLFKLGEHWQLDYCFEAFFWRVKHFFFGRTLGMTIIAMGVTFLLLRALQGVLFNVFTLLVWLLIGLLCIGAGKVCFYYYAYLTAALRNDSHACATMAGEFTMIYGVLAGCDEREYLRELQNALLWINFCFYFALLFWLIVGGTWGPVTLMGYAFLRAWQYWLARYQTLHYCLQFGIDAVLYVLDWVPVCFAGVVYALIGYGEKALLVWFALLGDFYILQYQVLTRLAQFFLARELHVDKVETPKAAVLMAKKILFVVVVVIALLTIYGALV